MARAAHTGEELAVAAQGTSAVPEIENMHLFLGTGVGGGGWADAGLAPCHLPPGSLVVTCHTVTTPHARLLSPHVAPMGEGGSLIAYLCA